ncbi:sterile alpha motif domain-containing protein 15-like [Mercenaria mercenaria]|uniref:sterile alpha motif domain-containing protein 15-like n=1 Tax=Mercenaria mercenaria TaxID=6596 RepID=UPI001E1E0329|nr:sterile alpha motif domain-containing protein 15-like [Mercenaria mercenaria]
MAEMKSAVEDLKDERVPQCLYWNVDQVADWIEDLGFPYYRSCITENLINGRKLIYLGASNLPNIGITDFEHIKIVAKSVRDLLTLEEPNWNRSISLPPRSDIGMFLEKKAGSGKEMDAVTYDKYLLDFKDPKWRPPLSNHCLILPHS